LPFSSLAKTSSLLATISPYRQLKSGMKSFFFV
jgi:hypothetical protein